MSSFRMTIDMLDKIITYCFYLLFFLTPLFWTAKNYELFEYNKMILTYGLTTVIVGAWVLKMLEEKTLIFKRTPLDIPLLLFLGANIISTIFSIDPHTSVWGYYSRSNGGLLSIITYLLLYFAFVANFKKENIKTLLKIGLASGLIISFWGILEHFGVSPSCVILRGEFNASCWIQDVQARVFASLGQPNWMAAYLSMLIFPALYFFLTSPTQKERIMYYLSLIVMYSAFTFTYSRGPTLGLISGMVVFVSFCSVHLQLPLVHNRFWSRRKTPPQNDNLGLLALPLILGSFLIINILFGSALTSFRLVSKFAAPVRPAIALPAATSGTQLENGGTESGQIRFIVWRGAWDIFKNNPIFGSGVETFAYSYYQYRPASHNLTSEWDFLYNKAHNEYLNYLSTTGTLGFGTYMLVIGTFIIWCLKLTQTVILSTAKNLSRMRNSNTFASLSAGKLRDPSLIVQDDKIILIFALLASYTSYLIYNFFLFSVVIIAIFFYLFPALAFVATEAVSSVKKIPSILHTAYSILPIYRRPIYTKIAKGVVILSTIYLLFSIFQLWYADTFFNQGEKASDLGNPGRAYNLLTIASELNSGEPFYRSELAYSAAAAAAALKETDATLSAQLADESLSQLRFTLTISPKNVSFWRTGIRTYFELSSLDKKYIDNILQALDNTIKLAPTDPKLYYNKALILESEGKKEESRQNLEQALKLKPNYLEARASLEEATATAKP